jgi:hypothetical protein
MRLRGYRHHSPVTVESPPIWPSKFIDLPDEQFEILARKYADKESGRIPLPRNVQELWAQHKYSVMARDPERYRQIGHSLAGGGDGTSMAELAAEMVDTLRRRPAAGRLTNALHHLWGYVRRYQEEAGLGQEADPALLMAAVRELTTRHSVTYLLHSTALSDLDTWIAMPEFTHGRARKGGD